MEPHFLKLYNRELQHIRSAAEEFSREHPKIASRLGIESFECSDPYVERLLEGFSFVAARIQLKLENQFDNFIFHLIEMVYPHYLAPTPAMGVIQLNPDLKEAGLIDGFTVKRGNQFRSLLGKGQQTPCLFTSTQDVTLWPLKIDSVEYLSSSAQAGYGLPTIDRLRAGLRVQISVTNNNNFNQLSLDELLLHFQGAGHIGCLVYEQILANCVGVAVKPTNRSPKMAETPYYKILDKDVIQPVGLDSEQAILPVTDRSFDGYRLLSEFFTLPEKFLFASVNGLAEAISLCDQSELELVFLFDRSDSRLENAIDASNIALHSVPVVNLFEKRCDRVLLNNNVNQYHVLPDRTRPLDLEVYQITEVQGFGADKEPDFEFRPFYAHSEHHHHKAYYMLNRKPRNFSSHQKKHGPRTSYLGTEAYISLVDEYEKKYSGNLKQLGVKALCTNRDLPLMMSIGRGQTDLTLVGGAPVESIRFINGPTKPKSSSVISRKENAWKLISHLSLNYLSLVDKDAQNGAAAFRELLSLYCDKNDQSGRKLIEGVQSITSKGVTRRLPFSGPVTFGRGMEVSMLCDEYAFEGTGLFLFGMIIEKFLQKYVSLNSFTELSLLSNERGKVHKWPVRAGTRNLL